MTAPYHPRIGQIVVLADDLTGAAGTAAMFADRQAVCIVALGMAATAVPHVAEDVLAIDLATRDRPLPDPDTVRAAVTWAFASGAALVAKRIDSTLRGHVRAEIAAAMEGAPPGTIALVSPAFPALGRTVRGGRLYVHDQPSVLIASALGRGARIGSLPLSMVRRGPAALAAALFALVAAGARVIVCDAERDDDLLTLAAGAAELPVLPCDPGPLTLALALARGLFKARPMRTHDLSAAAAPVLAVLGSRSALTAQQVAYAVRAGQLTLTSRTGDVSVAVRTANEPPAHGSPVLGLRPPGDGHDEIVTARLLAEKAAVLVGSGQFAGLYLTGGHTARTVLDALDVPLLHVLGSVLPLAALSFVAGGSYLGLAVVTKGGLVGGEDALARCLLALGADMPPELHDRM